MAELDISNRQVGAVQVLDLKGPIALGETSAKLHQKLRELVSEGRNQILINLANVTSIDSSGLGTLVAGYTTVEKSGGRLKLLNLSDRALELMTITKLFTVVDSFDDEKSALESFSGERAVAT